MPHKNGEVKVETNIAESQSNMGEALTLDSIINSIDAEAIAVGPSDKGPNRGAIIRHGTFVLWSFAGPISKMTKAGRQLFLNTVYYTAGLKDLPVLEKRTNGTRDQLFQSLAFAKKVPGYLNTIKRLYVPKSLETCTWEEIEAWVKTNRPYLRIQGSKRLVVDEFAKQLKLPNHKLSFYERCVQNLKEGKDKARSLEALIQYTGKTDMGDSPEKWETWFKENRDYLFFTDCWGFQLKADEQAKALKKPTTELRQWSSERINYKINLDSP